MQTWKANPNIQQQYYVPVIGGAFDRFNRAVGARFDSYGLEGVIYSWPRPTQTVQRGVKGSPREISDTRRLANSYSGIPESWDSYVHVWRAPYASLVLLGSLNRGYPGRNWVLETLMAFPIETYENTLNDRR